MKKHVIKLEVTEQELNVILDKKFNNTEMVNAIMMVADEDLTWFLDVCGFADSVQGTSLVLFSGIKELTEMYIKENNVTARDYLKFENVLQFFISMNPGMNRNLLLRTFKTDNILKYIRDEIKKKINLQSETFYYKPWTPGSKKKTI